MELTSAESLLLLSLGDDKGENPIGDVLELAIAGGLLLDLSAGGALVECGGLLLAEPDTELEDALLREAYVAILTAPKPREPGAWVQRLPRELKPIQRYVCERLVERAVLTEVPRSSFFGAHRYPTRDPAPEHELRERLAAVLSGDAAAEPAERRLAALLAPLELAGTLVPESERAEATDRARALAEEQWADGAAQETVDAVRDAVTAALGADRRPPAA
ncbi:MAG: hypothetical protein JWQ48_151, partial [Conexibacter sp.]|nr:hypothetical protein [Conexibacter sp.]